MSTTTEKNVGARDENEPGKRANVLTPLDDGPDPGDSGTPGPRSPEPDPGSTSGN